MGGVLGRLGSRRRGAKRRRTPPPPPDGDRPLLAVDVDGVVSLFGFGDDPPVAVEPAFELIEGKIHCISRASGRRLRRLGEHFEIFWASGWESQTGSLDDLLGLPEIPYLEFGGHAEFGSADWKLDPLGAYAAGCPLAWIDDSFDRRCYEWARSRSEPTLLVATEPATGLLDVHVDALLGWARSLGADGDEGGDGGS